MKNRISLTIIIPVYNVEEYIGECLQSVISQTVTCGVECILVDDCGQDKSVEISEKIISDYKGLIQFRILHHEFNKGLSDARNTGIRAAQGDYLYFLDSDDRLTPDCVESFLKVIERYPEVDMVQGATTSTHEISSSLSLSELQEKLQTDIIRDRKLIKKLILDFSISPVTAWNKLVRREFILQHKLFFKEGIIHEDNIWAFWLSKHVKSIAYNYHPTYIYRINPDGITGKKSEKSAKCRLLIIQEELANLSQERFEREVELRSILSDLCEYRIREKVDPTTLIDVSCSSTISYYIENNVKRLSTTARNMSGLYYRAVHYFMQTLFIHIL